MPAVTSSPAAAKRRYPPFVGRKDWNRDELPIGTVRFRQREHGKVRVIKVRLDGPKGRRWMNYARWWWEQNRGPVPPGLRVAHADGDMLNDSPDNYVLLNPGQVIQLQHRLDPEMARRNHAACGRSAAVRNVEFAALRRRTQWIRRQWYPVDVQRRVIYGGDAARRKQWMVYHERGIDRLVGQRLAAEARRARRTGDTVAAAFALRVAASLPEWWRQVRSAGLGWPGVNRMGACILFALARARRPLWTCELLEEVAEFRKLADWRPYRLIPSVLATCVSSMRQWVQSRREGPRMTMWWITPAGLAARVAAPRIIAVRGDRLATSAFKEFRRINTTEAAA